MNQIFNCGERSDIKVDMILLVEWTIFSWKKLFYMQMLQVKNKFMLKFLTCNIDLILYL